MYAGRNYGNLNASKAAGGYWKEEEDIREYTTLYSPLSDCRERENNESGSAMQIVRSYSLFTYILRKLYGILKYVPVSSGTK